MKKNIFWYLNLFCFLPSFCIAQLFPTKNYPQHYFQWPVDATPGLVANFGELRPNHYHMGLDCRTEGKVNLKVFAAADGYIAKIHVDPTGFGRAIYINHPNGLTTLYAHLNVFYPALETYLIEQQYHNQQWKIDQELPANLFKIKKGELIALSGNTGGSQGPHLHFEIRDTKSEKVLNPLLFGFPIEDNIAPDIIRLAVYDRSISTYEQTPKIYPLKKVNGKFQPAGGIIKVNSDKISFAITAYDRYTGSTNQNGIYKAELFKDGKEIAGFEMDSISYDDTRYLNAHIDFKTKINGGPFLQHLSKLPGYVNGIYKTAPKENGMIPLDDNDHHDIKIIVEDAQENSAVLQFDIQKTETTPVKNSSAEKLFEPNTINIFENESLSFYLPENAIYDAFHFKYSEKNSINGQKVFQLQNLYTPAQCYFPIKIKGNFNISDTGKIVMKQNTYNKERFQKASFEKGWYKAYFRDFGTYQLLLDISPPVVTPLFGFRDGMNISGMNKIVFSAIDNCKPIGSFNGYIDDQWILFTNDKELSFIYNIDKYCSPGEHILKIIVKDLVGNTTTKQYHFTR